MFGKNSYGSVADLYDAYVQADFDLGFFARKAAGCPGPVLELTAGTGRVTLSIHERNARLTCLDLSLEMLRTLQCRMADLSPRPWIVCADIRSLPVRNDYYQLALIPFNSFAELTAPRDQQDALREVHRVLADSGELICTLHNPLVRARSLDDRVRLLGRYELPTDRSLEVWIRGTLDRTTAVAHSKQTFRVYGPRGVLQSERVQDVHFALIGPEQFVDLAEQAGFQIVEVLGDYDGSSFSADSSNYMIWTVRKR